MTQLEIQARVNRDANILANAFQTRYQIRPSMAIVNQGWYREEYPFFRIVNNKVIKYSLNFEIHYHDFGSMLVSPYIEIIADASTPNQARLSSMLFKCEPAGSQTVRIIYSPEKETFQAMQNSELFALVVQKMCNDIDLNIERGALRAMLEAANQ